MQQQINDFSSNDITKLSRLFTPEEVELLKTLTVKSIKYGGNTINAMYDPNASIIYYLDNDGLPNGKKAIIAKAKPAAEENPPSESPAAGQYGNTGGYPNTGPENATNYANNVIDNTEKTSQKKKFAFSEMSSKKQIAFVLIVVVVFALAIVSVCNLVGLFSSPTVAQGNTNVAEGTEAVTEPVIGSEQLVDVIQVKKNMIPGDVITQECLERVSISSEIFNQIASTGNTIYYWDRVDTVVNMYICKYIPTGSYLTFNSVSGGISTVSNPWQISYDGYTYFNIPVQFGIADVGQYLIGSCADIVISKQTQLDTPTEETAPTAIEGLDHSVTVMEKTVVDTYSFSNIAIVGMIAQDGTNLFDTYYEYNSIPAGEQPICFENLFTTDKTFSSHVTPAFITIRIPTTQAAAIGTLTAENTTTTVKVNSDCENETTEKASFLSQEKFTSQALLKAASKILNFDINKY